MRSQFAFNILPPKPPGRKDIVEKANGARLFCGFEQLKLAADPSEISDCQQKNLRTTSTKNTHSVK
jgi:hypothetical protein